VSTLESNDKVACPTCGDEFTSLRGMKIHHTKSHGESIAGRQTQCDECGKTFRAQGSHIDEFEHNFCSEKCMGVWKSKNHVGENSPTWDGGDIELKCEFCGGAYKRVPARADSSRFCSRECRGEWRSENRSGDNNPSWNGGKVSIECEQCGDEFKVTPSVANERRFCSRECTADSMFKGDFQYGPGWNDKTRHQVRKRDEFQCQKCGLDQEKHTEQYGTKLHVHHISKARSFDDPELRNNPENLTTLCVVCHSRTERMMEHSDD